MTPKRIILLRHGESEANVDHEVYAQVPDWKITLTDAGIAQAREAGRKIAGLIGGESFGVFSSPYLRTLQTKEAMLEGMGRTPRNTATRRLRISTTPAIERARNSGCSSTALPRGNPVPMSTTAWRFSWIRCSGASSVKIARTTSFSSRTVSPSSASSRGGTIGRSRFSTRRRRCPTATFLS